MGCDKSRRGKTISCKRAPGVESEPANPQESRTDYAERKVVRRHRFLTVANPFTEKQSSHKSRDTRTNVHHSATGKVQCTHFTHPSFDSPHPMGKWIIDNRRPQWNENQEGTKFHA